MATMATKQTPRTADGLFLPVDVLYAVFRKLDFKSKVTSQLVCTAWNGLLRQPTDTIWESVCLHGRELRALSQSRSAGPTQSASNSGATAKLLTSITTWLVTRARGITEVEIADNCWCMAEIEAECVGDCLLLSGLLQSLGDRSPQLKLSVDWGCDAFHFREGSLRDTALLSSHLVSLQLHCRMNSADFTALAQLTRLHKLHLSCVNNDALNQEDLDKLGALTDLQYFSLWNVLQSEITSLSFLQSLQLTHLTLHPNLGCHAIMGHMPKLRFLSLDSWRQTDAQIRFPASLSGLCALQVLKLDHIIVSGSLHCLTDLTQLARLDIIKASGFHGTRRNPVLSRVIPAMSSLCHLCLMDVPFCMEACAWHSLSNLTTLALHCQHLQDDINPASFADLPPNLIDLALQGNGLRCLPLEITKLCHLRQLDLSSQMFPGRQSEYVAGPGLQLDKGLLDIVQMPSLQLLRLVQNDPHEFSEESKWSHAAARGAAEARGCKIELEVQFDSDDEGL